MVGIARRAALAHRATERDGADVKVLRPLFFDVRGREGRGAKSFLRLVARSAARDGEHEGGLVCRRRAARDAETTVPASVNAFTRVHKVQFNALIDETGVSGHDDCPAAPASGHGGDVKAFLPLFIDPLEGERVAHLVRLLRVRRAFRHDDDGRAGGRTRERGDVVSIVPLFQDPVLRQEMRRQVPNLRAEARTGVHDERPELSRTGDAGDE